MTTSFPRLQSLDPDLTDSDSSETQYLQDSLLDLFAVVEENSTVTSAPQTFPHEVETKAELPVFEKHAYPCSDTSVQIPISPSEWPQSPLLLRPTPHSKTKVRGIRYSSSKSYLKLPGYCHLPINSGRETPGKSFVIDFESDCFIGTVLLRVKNAPPVSFNSSHQQTKSYFDKRKRTFQAVVKGRFIKPGIPMSECITGQIFQRPPGRLPPKFILKAAIKLISRLAPQLDARISHASNPHFFSPLVSTAQSARKCSISEEEEHEGALVQDEKTKNYKLYSGADQSIEDWDMTEPHWSDPSSLMTNLNDTSSSPASTPLKTRKKAFDRLSSRKIKDPCFDTSTEYTFEFYQHLLHLDDLTLDLGRALGGKSSLEKLLDGQPIKFMAGRRKGEEEVDWLWSFDIWHEGMFEAAVGYEKVKE